jgi:hypothetical protein
LHLNRALDLNFYIMAVTRLKRKGLRNRAIANNKQAAIKRLTQKPEIKKVDVEEIKAQFAN